jgi:methionine-gamma-lyase
MKSHPIHPSSAMMSHGYHSSEAQGAVKPPLFLSSTYAFPDAETGKAWFEQAYGLEGAPPGSPGMIYSRLGHPNSELLEKRLCLWDEAEAGAVFSSGMAAISTTLFSFLKPGDLLLHADPLYGGTRHFLHTILQQWGVETLSFKAQEPAEQIMQRVLDRDDARPVSVIYVESPANPTNDLFDLQMLAELARKLSTPERKVRLVVDNTFLGPIGCQPLKHGADLVLYSATKYLGGHSDLLAGACLGSEADIAAVKATRTFFGSPLSPFDSWLLSRSLETYEVRAERQFATARKVADFLAGHPLVHKLRYLGHLQPGDAQYELFKRQYSHAGGMLAFEVEGGEKGAFTFLNALQHIKLAVSLGGTESLAEHPATMTHVEMAEEDKMAMGLTPALVRISVGLEHPEDLISELEQALEQVRTVLEASSASQFEVFELR